MTFLIRLLVPVAVALMAVAPATAQNYGSTIGSDDLYASRSSQSPEQGQSQGQSQPRTGGQQMSSDVATQQAAAPDTTNRYRADTIEAATDRQTVARDAAADRDRRDPDGTRLARARIKPSEFETYVSEIVDKPLRRFGTELLVPTSRGFTTPPNTTVPPDYRLNTGDTLVIGLSGSVDASNMRLAIDADGRIFIPRVGAIVVGGVRYGDIQSVIERAVARQYQAFKLAVTIGELHGITVYLTGFAATPGSYTVSSLSTLVNAVFAAGGPAAGGSFRDIEVRRNGRLVSRFDLYDLLLRGDKSADVLLQNGDVIYVGAAGPEVGVIGSVNSEAIFEAKPGESLADMLRYSGGINTVGDDTRLLLLDPLARSSWTQLVPADASGVVATRGQILRVLSGVGIAKPLRDQQVLVTVSGEVGKPGRFFVAAGTPLTAVVAQAGGLTGQAFPFGAVFTRESVRAQQRTSYAQALSDLEFLLTAQPLVSVNSSGGQSLEPTRLEAVRAVVDQLKARKPDGRLVIDIAPEATTIITPLTLENDDTLYIPPVPTTVGVFGTVPSPASFQFVPGATIGSYLGKAGGVQTVGDRRHIVVVRANGTLLAPRRGALARSVLNERALPGDVVFVPVAVNRGEFWSHLRDLSTVLVPAAIGVALATR